MQRTNWMQKLLDGMDLMDETLPGIPVVEIAGENRVLIENHEGVNEYSLERIGVKVKYGQVWICGCGLKLSKMTQERLVISGRIDCVQLKRGCR